MTDFAGLPALINVHRPQQVFVKEFTLHTSLFAMVVVAGLFCFFLHLHCPPPQKKELLLCWLAFLSKSPPLYLVTPS
jgi:hypothetical protein